MNIPNFRSGFPEFADVAQYPDAQITFWSNFAEKNVNKCRWGGQYEMGVRLFTAHYLVRRKNNQNAAAVGGTPGQLSGPTSSKTVGAASVSYDTAGANEPNAGHWNLTTYGKQYIRLVRMFGVGVVQL